jgi:hypothetical protein
VTAVQKRSLAQSTWWWWWSLSSVSWYLT